MKKLLVIGTVAFDTIETPFGKSEKILGGAGTYIALAASKFDVQVGLVSIVGEDFPQEHLDMMAQNKIDIQGIEIVKGGKTFFWKGKYHYDLNNRDTLETQLNVLENFNPVVPKEYKNAEVLVLGNLHPLVQLDVLEQMSTRPKVIILDTMNFWLDTALDHLLKVIKKVDVICINDDEARQLSGEYSLVKAARNIQNMGVKNIIIKRGEYGALLFLKKDIFFAPAFLLEEVFDPTGAGDTFAGGMAGYLTKEGKYSDTFMKNAIVQGNNLASFCVESFGVNRLLATSKDQIKKRLLKIVNLTNF